MKNLLLAVLFLLFSGQAKAWIESYPKEAFHRLESDGQNIGKTKSRLESTESRLVFHEHSLMKVTMFKKDQSLETNLKVETNQDLQVQSFEYEMKTKDSTVKLNGRRIGNQIRLEKEQAGNKQVRDLPIQEPLLMSPMTRPFALKNGLPEKGKKELSGFLLEPSALVILPLAMEVEKLAAKDRWSFKVAYLNHELVSQINEKGALLKETAGEFAGLKVEASPVTKEQYEKLSIRGTPTDLVRNSRVKFPKLANAKSLKRLKVRLKGAPLHNFQLERHRQSLEGTVLTIETEKTPPESASVQSLVGQEGLEKYLQGEISVPVNSPVIQKKAQELVGQENDLWKRAKKIHEFVHGHLQKDPFVSIPDALEAFQTGRGDCNEHAVLYTALARAAGIPTRTVVGLVYSDSFYGEGLPGFYYHAWVEVYTGKQWVSIDPTWNQIPSDPTHIAFVEGGADQQIQIASIIGRIELDLVESAARL